MTDFEKIAPLFAYQNSVEADRAETLLRSGSLFADNFRAELARNRAGHYVMTEAGYDAFLSAGIDAHSRASLTMPNATTAAIVKALGEDLEPGAFFGSTAALKSNCRRAFVCGLVDNDAETLTERGRHYYEAKRLYELPDARLTSWPAADYELIYEQTWLGRLGRCLTHGHLEMLGLAYAERTPIEKRRVGAIPGGLRAMLELVKAGMVNMDGEGPQSQFEIRENGCRLVQHIEDRAEQL